MLANVDGLCEDPVHGPCIFEAKTASAYKVGEWEDAIPDEYMIQIQHYMAVTGYQGAYIAVLIGGQRFPLEVCGAGRGTDRHADFPGRGFLVSCTRWYAPGPGWFQRLRPISCRTVFPTAFPQSEIALPGKAQKLLSQYDEACRQLEESTARKQEAENLLKEMLGDHEIGTAGNRVVTWKSVTQERLDTKTLKAEHPTLFKKYASQTSYRRFAIKTVRSLGG